MNKMKTSSCLFLATIFASLLLIGCSANQTDTSPDNQPPLKPRDIPSKPEHTEIEPLTFGGVIVVKFVEGSDIRLRNGKLVSLSNVSNVSIEDMNKLFQQYPLANIERQFTQPEEQIAKEQKQVESETGEDMPDLNLYYRLTLQNAGDAGAVIDGLNKLDIVELAYPEVAPAPPP